MATIDDLTTIVTTLATNAANQVNAINVQKTFLDNAVASVSGAADAAAITTAALTTLKNAYYGAFASAPTLRPDGTARQAGDRYFDTVAIAEKTWNGAAWYIPNIDSAALASVGGAALIGNGGESVADSLNALQLADYAALRVYAGVRKSVYITGYLAASAPSGIAGMFVRDDIDTTTADNGGTVIVTAGGKRYKRAYAGELHAKWFELVLDGTADNTTLVQKALDTGATDVMMPPGQCRINSTLFLRQNQTLRGPRRTNNNTLITYGATILFRPTVADTCITNAVGTDSNGVEDIQIDGNRNDSFGIGFLSSYANKVRRCGLRGTWDVGVYLHDAYVPEFDEISTTGASIKHCGIYLGATNGAVVRRLHMSSLPNDATVAMVGIGLYSGKNNTIDNPILQGPTIGISLFAPYATTIINPYFENTVCNMRLSDPAAGTPYSINVIGGAYSKPYSDHAQYTSRGPMVYFCNATGVTLTTPNFLDTNVSDALVWPMLASGGTQLVVHNAMYFGASGGARAQLFRETAGASPSLTIMGELYGTNGAVEILLKQDGSFGGNCQGIRVGAAGAISAVAWTPAVIATAVPALLKGAFYVPVMP